jgi:phospholipid/cholesterol/gamma-HCH transport system permease protein
MNMFGDLGKRINEVLEEVGDITILSVQTLFYAFRGNFSFNDLLAQMVRVGIDSLPVAVVTSAFVGMVFAVQIAYEFVKFGAGNVVGGVMSIAVARELAPALTAVVIAGRVGSAFAAEIGTMEVTEQIDAIYAMGTDPIKHLVVPRFIASTLMLPILTIFADLVGFFGGYLVAVYVVGINSFGYLDSASSFLSMNDITGGIIKALVFGMIISIIGCYMGLKTKGGARGVGEATTNSVVYSLMAIFVANYFMSLILFKR